MDKDGLAEVERRMQEAFDQLDKEIDPTFKYESTEKNKTNRYKIGMLLAGSLIKDDAPCLFLALRKSLLKI